jgi:hypothetical protein
VHGTGIYSVGVGPKGLALERFLDIKKKKKILLRPWKFKNSDLFLGQGGRTSHLTVLHVLID